MFQPDSPRLLLSAHIFISHEIFFTLFSLCLSDCSVFSSLTFSACLKFFSLSRAFATHVCTSACVCMCVCAAPALLTDKASLFIPETTCVSSLTAQFGWSGLTHTHTHTEESAFSLLCFCTSFDTHNQAVCDLICGE